MRKRIEAVKTKQKSQFEAKQKKGTKRCNFAVNDKVLKRNSRKDSRKWDRLTADWLGPYDWRLWDQRDHTKGSLSTEQQRWTNFCHLKPYVQRVVNPPCTDVSDKDGIELKTKTNSCHLKPYVQRVINPLCTDVSDKDGIELKTKTNSCHLKPYVQRVVNPLCTDVSDKDGIELKTKTNSCHLKPYVQRVVNPLCADVSDKDGIELKTKTNSCHLKPYVQRVVNPLCTDVSDKDGIELKTKTNSCHLKPYVQRVVNPPCTDVSDKDGIELKTKTNSCHLKPYVQRVVNPLCTDVSDKDGIELKTKTNTCHLKLYVQRVVNPPCTDVSDKDGIELKTKTNSCHLKLYVQRVVNPPCTDVSDKENRTEDKDQLLLSETLRAACGEPSMYRYIGQRWNRTEDKEQLLSSETVLQPSSASRHLAETTHILRQNVSKCGINLDTPVLLTYSDGGPDYTIPWRWPWPSHFILCQSVASIWTHQCSWHTLTVALTIVLYSGPSSWHMSCNSSHSTYTSPLQQTQRHTTATATLPNASCPCSTLACRIPYRNAALCLMNTRAASGIWKPWPQFAGQ